jgi:hypothetical protein
MVRKYTEKKRRAQLAIVKLDEARVTQNGDAKNAKWRR